MLTMLSITSRRETISMFSVILPLSIFDMSSTSLIRPRRCLLESVIFFRQFCTCCLSSILAVAIAVIPTIAFMGVRISWLMLERNSLFALVALTASSLAFSSSSIWRLVALKYTIKIPISVARITPQLKSSIPIH